MHNHTFTWNGQCSEDFGVYIEKYPDLNRSARKFKSASVPGRNGNIYQLEEAWEEVTVSYQIFAGRRKRGAAVCSFTEIMEWLHSADGYAELSDSYDYDHYRLGVFVDDMDIESQWHQFGRATIKFRCRPERYIVKEPIEVASGDTITNATNHVAKPIIELTGSGARSLLKITGKTQYPWQKAEAGATQLYEWVAVKDTQYVVASDDGNIRIKISGSSKVTNVATSNDGSSLTFDVTSAAVGYDYGVGYVQQVDPNTNYVLSGEALGYGMAIVYFAQASGYNNLTGMVNTTVSSSASPTTWKDFTLKFKTPSDCGYILIIFTRPAPVGAWTCQYRNIMLNKGTEALPFRAYADSSPSTLKVGDTTLTFDGTFNTAVVDCERENLALDGTDANNNAVITDAYDNISVDYLQLVQGDSEVTFDGEITAMTITPRFWEL